LGGTAQQYGASTNVSNNSSLRTNLAALANAQMTRHGCLTANLDKFLQDRRASDADLRHNHAAPANIL
jgi:hypothetical protein